MTKTESESALFLHFWPDQNLNDRPEAIGTRLKNVAYLNMAPWIFDRKHQHVCMFEDKEHVVRIRTKV